MMPPTRHDRGHDHDVEGHDQDHLDLLDVVRVASDQSRRAEDVGLLLGEAHHLAEDGAAQSRPIDIDVIDPK